MQEAKYRALFLNAPGSKKMLKQKMSAPCPDWVTFVEISCAILAALRLTNRKKLKQIIIELQAMWEGMQQTVTYRLGQKKLTRNIFFVATGTGDLCFTCYQFDMCLDLPSHKDICYNPSKEVRKEAEGSNMRTRKDGFLECNTCLEKAADDSVTVD